MDLQHIIKAHGLDLYVKEIIIMENDDPSGESVLPFFADGYPGIMFQESDNGVFRNPYRKALLDFFLYGHTLTPIELAVTGRYRMIVFQLFSFVAKTLLGINLKELNDDCFDLNQLRKVDTRPLTATLKRATKTAARVELMAGFLAEMVSNMLINHDLKTQLAVQLILNTNGTITVKELRQQLYITERTLQRQFIEYVGISPKQFARIIQFQSSLNRLSEESFSRLTDVVYENGYADQSHFIRSFKKYTGKKPSEFKPPR